MMTETNTENLIATYYQKYSWLVELIGQKLSERRFIHSKGVAETAVLMGLKWGANPETCFVAGLCHDIAKEMPKSEQERMLKHSGFCQDVRLFENPALWHAPVGALVLKNLSKQHQEITHEVVGACLWHTTAKAKMSTLEGIIFLADIIEPSRKWDDVDELRQIAAISLNQGIAMALKKNLAYLLSEEKYIHPDANEAYEYYKNLQ